MANDRFLAQQQAQAQVTTITITDATTNNTQIVTIGSVSWTHTNTAAESTTALVAADLAAELAALAQGGFAEISWSNPAAAPSTVVGTANNPGKLFTIVLTGTSSPTQATLPVNLSPADAADGVNWSTASKPVATNNVFFDNTDAPLLFNLGTISAVAIASLSIASSYTAQIGLPERASINAPTAANAQSSSPSTYEEYRQEWLQIGAITGAITLGDTQGGNGSPLIKIDLQSNTLTLLNQYSSGTSQDPFLAPNIMKGGTITAANIEGGSIDFAIFGGDTITITTLDVGANAGTIRTGAGATLGTINQGGGTMVTKSDITTLTMDGGTHTHQSGTIGTATVNAGTLALSSNITISTALVVGPGGTLDLSGCQGALTLSGTATFHGGSIILDPNDCLPTGIAYAFPDGFNSVTWTKSNAAANVTLS